MVSVDLFRRFLVLAALFFWQGGFTFYAAVVVPVGQHVLGHLRQGFVTREVTYYLNLAGLAALLLLTWDLLGLADPSSSRRWARRLLWLSMLICLGALFALHPRMDVLLESRGWIVRDPAAFRPLHRIYLWISTVQWLCALLYLLLTLSLWQAEERGTSLAPAARDKAKEE